MEQLTPDGIAGVAVVRAAPGERAAVAACLRITAGTAPQRGALSLGERVVDDVLVVDRGERGFELHLHGSPAVLAALAQRFALRAAPAASPAAALLRDALAEPQLDLALEQLDGGFARACAELAALPPPARRAAHAAAVARSRIALAMVEPQRVVFVGRQNAGKSTLFNALLGRERVLTGPQPGLTRDPVAEVTALAGYPYELVDTAGEGATANAPDALAVQRGRAARRDALCVLVVDAASGPQAFDLALAAECDLVIASKADLPRAPWPSQLACAAQVSAHGAAAALRLQLGDVLRQHRGLPPAGPVGGFAALTRAEFAALLALGDAPRTSA